MDSALLTKETALILRTCAADMSSYGGFKWPEIGPVEAPDWEPTAECGNGLHGFLWGAGDGSLASWEPDAKWLVAEIEEYIDLGDKVKFPRATVLHCGDRRSATEFIMAGRTMMGVVGAWVSAGDFGTATAGYRGTATAGNSGTATAGYIGTATAGYSGTATAGDFGTATAGNSGTATAGYRGTATAGDRGTATAGDFGTATAGKEGTATAGDRGTATAGYRGTATAGYRGTATAGDFGTATAGKEGTATAGKEGVLILLWWNGKTYKRAVGIIGREGLEPNTPYRLNDKGEFIRGDAS